MPSLQITRNTLGCIFFHCFMLHFREKTYAKTQEVWLVYNASLLSLLRQTKGFFCFSFNKRSQKHAAMKTWVFTYIFSSNLKATSKNSGTFHKTHKKVDFPLSVVFDQALQMLFIVYLSLL